MRIDRSFKNTILASLPADVTDRLALQRLDFEVMHELESQEKPLRFLYFVEEGMASMTTTFEDGGQVEIGTFGYESVVGLSALMGSRQSLNRIYTQIAGCGYRSPLEAARKEFALGGAFQFIALRYVQAQLLQAMQSTACNVKHSVDQRLARWLLLCSDRVKEDTFRMSQEFLAEMLGATRPTVTIAARLLKDKNIIKYHRGLIRIVDLPALEAESCECYRVIRNHLDNYTQFDSAIVA